MPAVSVLSSKLSWSTNIGSIVLPIVNVGVATISYFLPTVSTIRYCPYIHPSNLHFSIQLIKDLGFSSIDAQGMTVAPYIVGWFLVCFQAWHSDRTKDRGWHIMLSCAISLLGYIIIATTVTKSTGAAYFALFLIVGGNYSLFPLVM